MLYDHKGTIELKTHCQIFALKENFIVAQNMNARLNEYKKNFVFR